MICTGSRPLLPELAGLAEARPWTNREATDSHTVPGRLAVVGGGGVGVEMASAWQGLGASVILLVRADGLLPRMEPFAGELIAQAFTGAGIDVRIGVTVTAVRRHRRRGRAGPHRPALARRPLLPLHQRSLAPPARGLPELS